ncbi:MAG: site-specific DNA-methyltransferase [Opitutaceae bacterium]|jgi:site-specific DNA-methyltransferase (adenine-specific)|nr:site-specific DNA-methyltransferase [Opitutaceae bacterium]
MDYVLQESASASERPITVQGSMILGGDARHILSRLPDRCVRSIVTSPPYWGLRDYGIDGQIGLEPTLDAFIAQLVDVFREARRVLRDDGTFWLNIGDGYTSGNRGWRAPDKKNPARAMNTRPDTPAGLKPKDLIGVPWRLAFALQADGWYLRSDIIWNKPNAMPESVKDRPTRSHEFLFLFSKSEQYHYDSEAVMEDREDGSGKRNRRSVWSVNTEPFRDAHFATFPPPLIQPCVLAGTEAGDYVLDPFFGAGTVGVVCGALRRNFIGIELNPDYLTLAARRIDSANTTHAHQPSPARSSGRIRRQLAPAA